VYDPANSGVSRRGDEHRRLRDGPLIGHRAARKPDPERVEERVDARERSDEAIRTIGVEGLNAQSLAEWIAISGAPRERDELPPVGEQALGEGPTSEAERAGDGIELIVGHVGLPIERATSS
jgi:hypothetical protein